MTEVGRRQAARSRADFHTHSRHSDGLLSPAALVDMAAANGVTVLALTDHDTTAGVAEAIAAGRRVGVRVIPGVEISADLPDGSDAHLLGYFSRVDDPAFQSQLQAYRAGRQQRGRTMLAKLEALGMPLAWEWVLAIAGEAAVGRPHVAQALVERSYVGSIREAFDRFLYTGGPADADREKLAPAEAIRLIRRSGGVAVLAHPFFLPDPESAIRTLVPAGLQGVEVYYKNAAREEVARFAAMAAAHGLEAGGGSDYHGIHDDEVEPGRFPFPDAAVDRLLTFMEAQWAATMRGSAEGSRL